jgi:hypothetical protein
MRVLVRWAAGFAQSTTTELFRLVIVRTGPVDLVPEGYGGVPRLGAEAHPHWARD